MYGVDFSHHNTTYNFTNEEFAICKATEGKTYLDPEFHNHIKKALSKGMYIGAYHYARPENNTPEEEAVNFVNAIKPYLGNILLALDFEGKALAVKNSENWAHRFMFTVENLTGVKPIIYLQKSALKLFPNVAKMGYELWVADYLGIGNDITTTPFSAYILKQYTNNPVDKDYFFGNSADWRALCTNKKQSTVDTDTDKHFCGCEICEAIKEVLES